MSNFNYQKAWFLFAKPAIENLNNNQKEVFYKVLPLVRDLNQGRDLNIPLNLEIKKVLNILTDKELAELARASYFYGHWEPSFTETLFSNLQGESWKVANCIDQILREKLEVPHPLQIHEGNLRVTFSSKDCWLWEEFGLATKENVIKFIDSEKTLAFGENSLNASAEILKNQIGDLWDTENIDLLPNNEDYNNYLKLIKAKELEKNEKRKADKLKSLKNEIATAELEYF